MQSLVTERTASAHNRLDMLADVLRQSREVDRSSVEQEADAIGEQLCKKILELERDSLADGVREARRCGLVAAVRARDRRATVAQAHDDHRGEPVGAQPPGEVRLAGQHGPLPGLRGFPTAFNFRLSTVWMPRVEYGFVKVTVYEGVVSLVGVVTWFFIEIVGAAVSIVKLVRDCAPLDAALPAVSAKLTVQSAYVPSASDIKVITLDPNSICDETPTQLPENEHVPASLTVTV